MKFNAHKNRFTFAILSERPCRNCCICLNWVSDLLSKCYTEWLRAILVRATHWPRATIVRHAGFLLYFRFPTCRSAELDANRCAKSTPQLHQITVLSSLQTNIFTLLEKITISDRWQNFSITHCKKKQFCSLPVPFLNFIALYVFSTEKNSSIWGRCCLSAWRLVWWVYRGE